MNGASDGSTEAGSGEAILVTGAAGGIGRATVRLLRERTAQHGGATVIAADLPEALEAPEAFDDAAGEPASAEHPGSGRPESGRPESGRPESGQFERIELDVTDADAVERAIEQIGRRFRLRAVVNAAGVITAAPALETSRPDLRRMVEVNALGVAHVSQAAARVMVRQGGHTPGQRPERAIVTIASNAGTGPRGGFAAYGASKAFASSYTRSLGLELGGSGIRCVVLNPGTTRTPMVERMWDCADRSDQAIAGDPELFRTGIPLHRVADPEDIAEVVEFMVSARAAHITAAEVTVDGGASQR